MISGFKRTFNDNQEKALVEYIVDMEARLQGLSSKELRKLAYDFATDLKISHNFNAETGILYFFYLQYKHIYYFSHS